MTNQNYKAGKEFENFVVHHLEQIGLDVEEQVCIGLRPTGGAHIVDAIAKGQYLNSFKYQFVAGTAEEKIPYEQCCLQHACDTYGYKKAFLVLAGPGWKHDTEYKEGCFAKYLNTPNVEVVSYEEFMKVVNCL